MSDAVARLLERLDGVQRIRTGWRAACPSHPDRRPSLNVREGLDGRALLYDFGGCRTVDILAKLGLSWADLFSSTSRRSSARPCPRRSLLDDARHEVVALARRQCRRLDRYRELNAAADSIRAGFQVVAVARRVATLLGDGDIAWDLLAHAAQLETLTLAADARLDDEMAT